MVFEATPSLAKSEEAVDRLLVLFDSSASRAAGFGAQQKLLTQLLKALGKARVKVACFDQTVGDGDYKTRRPLGATDLNGTTNEDRTNYFQNVPISALDRILWLESDRMGHFLGVVTQARLDEQRGVVQNEKRQWEN